MVKCPVPGCPHSNTSPGVKFHRFPSNPALCRDWVIRCGDTAEEEDLAMWKKRRMCENHFAPTQYALTNGKKILIPSAKPTVNVRDYPTHEVELVLDEKTSPGHFYVVVDDKIVVIRVAYEKGQNPIKKAAVLKAHLLPSSTSGDPVEPMVVDASSSVCITASSPSPPAPLSSASPHPSATSTELEDMKKKEARVRHSLNLFIRSSRTHRLDALAQKAKITAVKARHRTAMLQLKERQDKQLFKAKEKNQKYFTSLRKLYSAKQIQLLLKGKTQAKWSDEEMGKAITLRYKSHPYDYLRSLGHPYPAKRTIQDWIQKFDFSAGILYPVLNLCKSELEDRPELDQQAVLAMDEMHLEGEYVYDEGEDRIYPPLTNINLYVARGLFSPWKQAVKYEFDDRMEMPELQTLISKLEDSNIAIRAMTSDLGPKNQSLLKKLGVGVKKIPTGLSNKVMYEITSSFEHPTRKGDRVSVFLDPPHLIKRMRDNLLDHGLEIDKGVWIRKEDLEKLVQVDAAEYQSNFKLTEKHVNVKGLGRTNVLLAVQVFSRTTAALWRKIFPNRPQEADFLELVNDWFDLFNSRTPQHIDPKKLPFGLRLSDQTKLLERMDVATMRMKVGDAKTLYPFQRGILISNNSIRELYDSLKKGPLNISYILTHKLNQDVVENSFSCIRGSGGFHTKPNALSVKARVKILCLQWESRTFGHTSVQADEDEGGSGFITARMLSSLMKRNPSPAPTPILPQLPEEEPFCCELTVENAEEVLSSMGQNQSCEQGGKEYAAGYVAQKFCGSKDGNEYVYLKADEEDEGVLKPHSWVVALQKDHLCIPSLFWLNWCSRFEKEFQDFHMTEEQRLHPEQEAVIGVNAECGAVLGLSKALELKYDDYPGLPFEVIHHFIKTRTSFRLKTLNKNLKLKRHEAAQRREDAIARNRTKSRRSKPNSDGNTADNQDENINNEDGRQSDRVDEFLVIRQFKEHSDFYYSPDFNHVYNRQQLAEMGGCA